MAVSPRSALATSAVQAPPEKRTGGGLKEFLKEKTGVTGAGTLAFGLAAFAISKEIIIIHSEVLMHTHYGNVEDHSRELFSVWLNGERFSGDLPRTWEVLLDAVKRVAGTEVVDEIECELSKGN